MRVLRLLALGFAAFMAVDAHALAVTFAFTAHFTDDPFALSGFWAPISGNFTFDSVAADSSPMPASVGPFTGAFAARVA
jgi:hypothetical protein